MKRKAEEPGSDAKQEHVFAVPKVKTFFAYKVGNNIGTSRSVIIFFFYD